MTRIVGLICALFLLMTVGSAMAGEHRYADQNGVKIHYVATGEGPLVVMIHGFPDYWYTWRHLMPVLGADYRVAAVDLRGYNRSDKPAGVANYAMPLLIGDIAAVITAEGAEKAIVIGHDWGAAIAWQVALNAPQFVDRLVILSVPHPRGFAREMATNADQQANSQYARDFMAEGAEDALTAEGLAGWVRDPEAKKAYVEAFKRSDFSGMLNYYRANYPQGAGEEGTAAQPPGLPQITSPVLVIHGLEDRALNAAGHSGTWNWIDQDTTLLMIPNAGHFVQHEATNLVNTTIRDWLAQRR
ncbi:MAG: alpha/beta fold hydrolase [Alphaproteobacteria bacterium]